MTPWQSRPLDGHPVSFWRSAVVWAADDGVEPASPINCEARDAAIWSLVAAKHPPATPPRRPIARRYRLLRFRFAGNCTVENYKWTSVVGCAPIVEPVRDYFLLRSSSFEYLVPCRVNWSARPFLVIW